MQFTSGWCEVCLTKLLSTSILLGGPGKTVQTDESLFNETTSISESLE